jgi:autotransporter-associated beta strand protein
MKRMTFANGHLPLARHLAMALMLLMTSVTHAQTWDGGGGDSLWGTGLNWSGNTVPAANTNLFFGSGFGSGNPTVDADYSVARLTFTRQAVVTIDTNSAANDLTLNVLAGFNNADGMIRVQSSDFTHEINSNIILRANPGTDVFWSGNNEDPPPGFPLRWGSGIRRTGALIAHDASGNPTTHTLLSGNSFGDGTRVPFLFDFSGAPAFGLNDGRVNHTLTFNARLRFNNPNQISGSISMNGGVIQWTGAGDFTMARDSSGTPAVGTWNALTAGGWAAIGADHGVNIGGALAPITANFRVVLGSGDATHTVLLKNPMSNTGDMFIQSYDGPAALEGRLLGAITLAAGNQDLNFLGNGTIELAAPNVTGNGRINVAGGNVLVNLPAALGASTNLIRMMNSDNAAFPNSDAALLTNGSMTIPNPIQLHTVNPDRATIGGNTSASSTFSGNITMGSGAVGKNLTVSAASGGTVTFSGVLDEPGGASAAALTKRGLGSVILSNTNGYDGSTTIEQGKLIVNGSIASSSGVTVNAGATLGGSGTVSTISGAGTVAPGNSPGILSATSLDPSGGADFVFEFTQFGSPTWASPSASGNDVLRLTSATPFLSALTSANVVDVIFAVPGNDADDLVGQTFRGAFFTEEDGDFLAMVNGATFRYLAPSFLQPVDVTLSTVAENGGRVLQFTVNVVPEPSVAMAGLMLVGGTALRRRK